MGGNVFKNEPDVSIKRYDVKQYQTVASRLENYLKALDIECRIPKSVRDKKDFGDLDIIVENTDKARLAVVDFQMKFCHPNLCMNGSVWSALLKNEFQIDFIFVDNLDYADAYFSWNDLGNLIGKIAKKVGLKHGHKGLFIVQRIANHNFEIPVADDIWTTLSALKLNCFQFHAGFNCYEDMFDWLTKSPYFRKEFYPLEGQSNKDRVRDRKRKTYMAFLEWLHSKEDIDGDGKLPEKDSRNEFALMLFPAARKQYEENIKFAAECKVINDKFGGRKIMDLGYQGVDIGKIIRKIKTTFNREYLLEVEASKCNDIIKLIASDTL